MTKFLSGSTMFAALVVASITQVAYAQGNNGGGNGGCGVGQQTNGCGGTTPAPVHNYSPHFTGKQYQGQAQGQVQGQQQSSRNSNRNTNANVNANQNLNTNNVRSSNRNNNVAYGGSSTSSSASRSSSVNAGNNQSMTFNEAKQFRHTPDVYGNFAGSATSPCERNTFGIGGSMPGYGGLIQIPVKSSECWSERSADRLIAMGCVNAGLAVLAGNPVAVALQNNPCGSTGRVLRRKN